MSVEIQSEIKNGFTNTEIQAMKEQQPEPIRFMIEGEDGKAKFNAYRLRAEDGLAYVNRVCNKIFEKYEGVLRLRVYTRADQRSFKEIAYAERTKDVEFVQFLIEE